ncbi:trans-aconitate 3-methyltransferase [Diutina catenulata]
MAQYSEATFNTQHYDDSRPTYPVAFYQTVLEKTEGRDLAVDIGCGTGIVTFKLAPHFKQVIGTDPSQAMIDQCRKSASDTKNVSFYIGNGEHHPSQVAPKSVDLITAGECAHWFDHAKFFEESHRVLKAGGTLAFWLYKDPIFADPKANEIYRKYTWESSFDHKADETFERYMGPYYQQPGHDYLGSLLKEKPVPADLFTDIERVEYLLDEHQKPTTIPSTPLSIKKTVTMSWFNNYVRSWSAYHSWMKDHGDKYNIADAFTRELWDSMSWDENTEVVIEFETMYTIAKSK